MARDDVNIKVSMDVAEAIAGWKQVADGPMALQDALKRVHELEAKGSKTMLENADQMVGKWMSIANGIKLATNFLTSYLDAAQRARQETVNARRDIDALQRQYQITQGIPSGAGADAALQNIAAVAQQAKASPGQAFGAANLLAGFGVGRKEAEGSALAEVLALQEAVDVSGNKVNGEALSRAVLEILDRSNQPISGKTIRPLAAKAMSLVGQAKGFGPSTMEEFADVATAAKDAGLSTPDGLSIFAAMREDEDTLRAKKQFRTLFDNKILPGEREKITALRQRAGQFGRGGLSYDEIGEIASGSYAAQEQLAETQFQFSSAGSRGLNSDSIRERLQTMIRQQPGYEGGSVAEHLYMGSFDWLDWAVGPDAATKIISGIPGGGAEQRNARYQELTGRSPMIEVRVQIDAPDGRDIHREVQAVELNGL